MIPDWSQCYVVRLSACNPTEFATCLSLPQVFSDPDFYVSFVGDVLLLFVIKESYVHLRSLFSGISVILVSVHRDIHSVTRSEEPTFSNTHGPTLFLHVTIV